MERIISKSVSLLLSTVLAVQAPTLLYAQDIESQAVTDTQAELLLDIRAGQLRQEALTRIQICLQVKAPDECRTELQLDQGELNAINSSVSGMKNVAATAEASTSIPEKERAQIASAASSLADVMGKCSAGIADDASSFDLNNVNLSVASTSSENATDCTAELVKDATKALRDASNGAKNACRLLGENRESCEKEVEKVTAEAESAMASFAAALGPVLTICAASAGTACAIAAVLAVLSAIFSKGGGGNGSGDGSGNGKKSGEQGVVGGEAPKDGEVTGTPAAVRGSGGSWTSKDLAGGRVQFSNGTDTLIVNGYKVASNWTVEDGDEPAAAIVGSLKKDGIEKYLGAENAKHSGFDVGPIIFDVGNSRFIFGFCIPLSEEQRTGANLSGAKFRQYLVESNGPNSTLRSAEIVECTTS